MGSGAESAEVTAIEVSWGASVVEVGSGVTELEDVELVTCSVVDVEETSVELSAETGIEGVTEEVASKKVVGMLEVTPPSGVVKVLVAEDSTVAVDTLVNVVGITDVTLGCSDALLETVVLLSEMLEKLIEALELGERVKVAVVTDREESVEMPSEGIVVDALVALVSGIDTDVVESSEIVDPLTVDDESETTRVSVRDSVRVGVRLSEIVELS